jgi:branched-chain amino acid transport system ATP-binding protein
MAATGKAPGALRFGAATEAASAPRPPMPASSLEVSEVSVEFSGLRALDHVSLTLSPGEVLGLIGPNGSGKTTLVNAITGQVPVAGGSIRIGGTLLSGLAPRQTALLRVARTFQIVRLFNNLTVRENVETAALARGDGIRTAGAKADSLLAEYDLASRADELASNLNYGDKRRVEIARALAADPQFLLLDEPAAGMNEAETEVLLHHLAELPRSRGLGLLIIDHDMGLIMRLCDRLQVLASGRTIAEGDAKSVRANPAVIEAYLGASAAHA